MALHRPILMASVCALSVLALSACQSNPVTPPGHGPAQLTFQHLEPLPLKVSGVKTLMKHTETLPDGFVLSPAEVFQNYLISRYQTLGGEGLLQAAVEKSAVTKTYRPSEDQIGRFFDVAGFDSYNISLTVRLEHIDTAGAIRYGTVLNAHRVVNVSEHASIAEREREQSRALEAMFREFDLLVRKVVVEDMGLMIPKVQRM